MANSNSITIDRSSRRASAKSLVPTPVAPTIPPMSIAAYHLAELEAMSDRLYEIASGVQSLRQFVDDQVEGADDDAVPLIKWRGYDILMLIAEQTASLSGEMREAHALMVEEVPGLSFEVGKRALLSKGDECPSH